MVHSVSQEAAGSSPIAPAIFASVVACAECARVKNAALKFAEPTCAYHSYLALLKIERNLKSRGCPAQSGVRRNPFRAFTDWASFKLRRVISLTVGAGQPVHNRLGFPR